jgi:LEA14-like dessication related protein
MLKRSLLAASVFATAAGCAFPTAPAADGMGVQLSERAVPEQPGSVMLCITNPNPDALVFRRVTITLDRAGMPLAAGSSSAPIVVPALSSTRVPLAVVASERDRPAQRGGSLRPHDVNYRVDGSVALDRAFGLNISYRHSGHLDVVSSSIVGVLSRCTGSDFAVPL